MRAAVSAFFQRNFIIHVLEGGLYMGGLAFISTDVVLPTLIGEMGANAFTIALVPVLLGFGFNVLGVFVAPLVERLPQRKPFVLLTGFCQRLPYLAAACALWWMGAATPQTLIWIMLGAQLLSGLIGGLGVNAWMEMMTRAIEPRYRASGWALRYILQALIGIGAGVAVLAILSWDQGPRGLAVLHFITFGFLMLSFFAQLPLREPPPPPVEAETEPPRESYRQYLRSLPGLLRGQADFQRLLLVRILGMGYLVATPFMSSFALTASGSGKEKAGLLLSAMMVGSLAGNLFAAYAGHRWGGKSVSLMAKLLFVVLVAVLLVSHHFTAFLGAFFLFGFGLFMDRVGELTLAMEICPAARRPAYLGILTVAVGISFLLAATVSALAFTGGGFIGVCVAGCVFMLACIMVIWRLPASAHHA